MKRIILTLLLSSFGLVATLAQSQLGMNYQAVIRNADGKIIADTKVGIRINILKVSTSGESVYTETFSPTTNEFGLITLIIGQGQAKYGKYSNIDWSSTNYFLKIELDIAGGTAYEEMGVSQLLSVPYANYAFDGVGGKSAYQIWIDRGNTGSEEDFINSLTGPSGKSAYQAWLDLGNTGTQQDFINSISAVGRSVYDIWLGLGNIGTQQDFINSITGQSGPSGKSAYQAWLDLGNTGTQQDFINSITGQSGQSGPSGKSAYQVWLELPGNDAKTEEDFINSITGASGKSAYQVWLDLGNIGTEDVFISSLTGPPGTSSWEDAEANVSTQNKVQVKSDGKNPEVPLFEVKNSKGETIFAVYENRVEIIVDEEAGGEKNRGGFAISGRTTTKGTKEILSVTPNLTQFYVDESTTKNRGGFAISGRTTTKEGETDILTVTPNLTQIFVEEPTSKNRGGFAISGRTTTKEGEADILTVTPSLTQVFVEEPTSKNRGGFAISGRTTTKAPVDLLNMTPSLTQFYVEEPTTKNRGGFAISGRTTTKEGEADILTVTPSLTQVFVEETTTKNRGGFAISGRTTTKEIKEMFNVTPNETTIYVDEPTAKNRGGFAISGRTTTKTGGEILLVTPSLTQIYVDETTTTKNRGGFAISGRTTTKTPIDLLNITPSLTQFYVEEPTTKNRGGFAISGRTTTKEGEADILTVTPSLTQVFVEETTTKNRGGFAISGRTTTKETGIYDVLTVAPERTDVYIKPSLSKNSLPIGFGVHGLSENALQSTEFFSISGTGTYIATSLAVKPKVVTGLITGITQSSATGAGTVPDIGGTDVTIMASGIVYHTAGAKLLSVEEVVGMAQGEGGIVSGGESANFNSLEMKNLNPGTQYQVRAFATNSDGLTGYGLPRDFTTLPAHIVTINVTDEIIPINATVTFWKEGKEPIVSPPASTHTFNLSEGLYAYKVEAVDPGYPSYTNSYYSVWGNQTEDIVLSLSENNRVEFIVTNQYGAPVDSVDISVLGFPSDLTNSLGKATLYLPEDTHNYSVTRPKGYDNFIPGGPVTVIVGVNPPVEITLMKQHKVTFIVNNPNGTPVNWAEIILTKVVGPGSGYIYVSNGIGETFLPSDADGEWSYTVNSEVGLQANGIIMVGQPNVVELVQLQAPPTAYTVRYKIVNDATSEIINGASVHLSSPGLFDDVKTSGVSDLQGHVTFTEVLPSTDYTLVIEKDGFIQYLGEYIEINQNSPQYDPENPGTFKVETMRLILGQTP